MTSQLDIPNNPIATLDGAITEDIPRHELLEATARARSIGTELRFVIAGDSDEFVEAKSVVNEYGGTALSYKSGESAFFAASKSMDTEQLNRASAAAGGESDMGASALAFVGVLEDEGLKARSSSPSRWMWILFGLAVFFVVFQLWNYLRARKRAARRKAKFRERKDVLSDWAARLTPEIDAVTAHAGRLDSKDQRTLIETSDQVVKVVPAVADATSLGELDAAEMRIARAATKLRTLRLKLDV